MVSNSLNPSVAPQRMWVNSLWHPFGSATSPGSIIYSSLLCGSIVSRSAAGCTSIVLPTTTNILGCVVASTAARHTVRSISSPKSTTYGRICEPSGALSPMQMSGLAGSISYASQGCSVEAFLSASPWICITLVEPARSCRSSPFCVITVTEYHSSKAAIMRCPSLGSLAKIWRRIGLKKSSTRCRRSLQSLRLPQYHAPRLARASTSSESHNPPSPRKVGSPLSRLIPAPV